jgi:2-iminobutanoate/2-iminopropanoate deaminase
MIRTIAVALALAVAACAHDGTNAPATAVPLASAAKVLQSAHAPKAIGPYSQAVQTPAGRFLFLSGQIPLDPATGKIVEGDIVAQTDRVMQNLQFVLGAAGASLDDVVKTTIFLVDLGDFAKVNETYARYFKQAPPARATVQVAALPRGSLVEIESVAMPGLGLAGLGGVKPIQSAQAPKAIGPYSQAMNAPAGQFIYLSGQIPIDPVSGQMVEGDIVAQTDRVMKNLAAVLDAGGASFDNVVKTTIFLVDLADFGKVNETYGRYFKTAPPARATVQVRALPRGSRVEIEAIAAM